jgi:hypothetical protein
MSNNTLEYERAAQLYFKQNPTIVQKYYSLTLLKTLVDAMRPSLPTAVTARLAFDRCVANGTLQRTDGKGDRDDAQASVDRAQQNFDRVVHEVQTAPLTADEQAYFGSLSQSDLSAKYWHNDGYNQFRVRYDLAHQQAGFRLPPRPSQGAVSDGGDYELTPAEYHALPASVLKQKIREPRFKAAVYRLIAEHKI